MASTIELSQDERDALADVLDTNYAVTRKSTPALQPLSMYSSELKGLKQIAKLLDSASKSGALAEDETTRARYFNTLANQGLIEGSPDSPKLTPLATPFLDYLATEPTDEQWRGLENGLEHSLVRGLAERMARGEPVSETFKRVWLNVQTLFEYVGSTELDPLLNDADRLLDLFRINSVGWEIPRYFRLKPDDRAKFDAAFKKVPRTTEWTPTYKIERSASAYKDAGAQFQADVRFRISGFLNAYERLRKEMGVALPFLNRDLGVRLAKSEGAAPVAVASSLSLSHPRQLIVTGCPGSGKSHYVDLLAAEAGVKTFRTQFHPESTFFDFVGAYKPQPIYEAPGGPALLEADGSPRAGGRPLIDYRFVPGPFVRAYTYALQHPAEHVVLLIEELNRANAAAVFGDLLQLLDRDIDGTSKYEVMPSPDLCSHLAKLGLPAEMLSLPSNLYMWATMNSADQGVFPLDTAFRRRWNYVYKGYAEPCRYENGVQPRITFGGKAYPWDAFRSVLNQRLIELGVHEDKLVGPYFLTLEQMASPASVLEKLFLYLWDDVLRFRQDELFNAKSFSLVASVWDGGNGIPLSIDLPASLVGDETIPDQPSVEPVASEASDTSS